MKFYKRFITFINVLFVHAFNVFNVPKTFSNVYNCGSNSTSSICIVGERVYQPQDQITAHNLIEWQAATASKAITHSMLRAEKNGNITYGDRIGRNGACDSNLRTKQLPESRRTWSVVSATSACCYRYSSSSSSSRLAGRRRLSYGHVISSSFILRA